MKITTFDPLISTQDPDGVVKVFEALGFEKKHAPVTAVENGQIQSYRLKHPSGYHVDVAQTLLDRKQDAMIIRMNVDDFEAAYDILVAHGFRNTRGDNTLDTSSATTATMVSPSGFTIALIKHIKNHDEQR